jgi:tetratricopeptide (TPR) repeat protein
MAFHRAGDLRQSILSFNRAMELAPDQTDSYATLADVLCEARDLDTAIEVLNAGLNACDNHPGLLQKAAAVCSQAGLFGDAVKYMEQVVEALPGYRQAWVNLALYYVLTEDLEKSEEAAKQAIQVEPDHWEGYYHLGNLYETVRLYDKAVEEYRKAIELAPQDEYRPELNLAAVLIEMDDDARNEDAMGMFDKYELTQEAIQILKRIAPQTEPKDLRPHYNLALAYGKLGEKGAAKELLDLILSNEPKESELYAAAEALKINLFSTSEQIKQSQALSSLQQMTKVGSFYGNVRGRAVPKKDDEE